MNWVRGAFRTKESRECLDRDVGVGQHLHYQPWRLGGKSREGNVVALTHKWKEDA